MKFYLLPHPAAAGEACSFLDYRSLVEGLTSSSEHTGTKNIIDQSEPPGKWLNTQLKYIHVDFNTC